MDCCSFKASLTDSLMDFLKSSMISFMSENSSIVRVCFVSSVLIPLPLSSPLLGVGGGGWHYCNRSTGWSCPIAWAQAACSAGSWWGRWWDRGEMSKAWSSKAFTASSSIALLFVLAFKALIALTCSVTSDLRWGLKGSLGAFSAPSLAHRDRLGQERGQGRDPGV